MREDVLELVKSIKEPSTRTTNLYSWLALRGAAWMIDRGKVTSSEDSSSPGSSRRRSEKEQEKLLEREKREILRSIVRATRTRDRDEEGLARDLKTAEELMDEVEGALKRAGYRLRKVEVRLVSRGLVGASSGLGEIPFEVGLCFDPILNLPYIPGSSIKGAVRAAYERLKDDKEGGRGEDAKRLFGDTGEGAHAGLVGFTDAYPVRVDRVAANEPGYLLYPDVINPHYKDAENELDVRPVPVIHLTLAPGTVFRFYMFYTPEGRGPYRLRGDLAESPEQRLEALGSLDKAVLYALALGVGARTSVGYSRFEVVEYASV